MESGLKRIMIPRSCWKSYRSLSRMRRVEKISKKSDGIRGCATDGKNAWKRCHPIVSWSSQHVFPIPSIPHSYVLTTNRGMSSIECNSECLIPNNIVDCTSSVKEYYSNLLGENHEEIYSYETKLMRNGSQTWWTCYFQCPITGYKVYSGYVHPELRKIVLRDNSCDVKWVDGKIYYSKKKHSRRAAAALAMDCLRLSSDAIVKSSSGGIDLKRLCLESMPFDLSAKIKQIQAECEVQGVDLNTIDRSKNEALDSSTILSGDLGMRLKIFIYDRYFSNGKTLKNAYEFETKSFPQDGEERKTWTCTFTCPLTQKKIYSGSIEAGLKPSLFGRENCITFGDFERAYYLNKEDAKRACDAKIADYLDPSYLSQLDVSSSNRMICSNLSKIQSNGCGQEAVKPEEISNIRRSSEALEALAKLHRLYNPKDLRLSTINEGVTYSSSESFGKAVWTAEYQSQITNETFSSGVLKSEDSMHISGKTYYFNKKIARDAAVGLAVDCFYHRGGWLTNRSGNEFKFPKENLSDYSTFCLDSPYDSAPELKCVLDMYIPAEKIPQLSITPKQVMNNRYQKLFRGTGNVLKDDSFITESLSIDVDGITRIYWTSTFECPVTGRLFPSGTLVHIDENGSDVDSSQIQNIDGVIYYLDRKNAEHAAAGRAYDILSGTNFFSSFGMNEYQKIPQFCKEDPSYTSDEEEDFVIQSIPIAGSSSRKTDSSPTAVEVVLDAWADYNMNVTLSGMVRDAGQISHVVNTAASWRNKLNKILKKEMDPSSSTSSLDSHCLMSSLDRTPVTTFSCNAILKALAKCNVGAYSADSHRVENIAQDILILMHNLSLQTPLSCKPDTESFNFYILCLQSSSHTEIATKAESILSDMIDGNNLFGIQLPKPDCNTFNFVMKLWTVVSDRDQNVEVERLFHKLEEQGLCPNKDTFKLFLQSLSNRCKYTEDDSFVPFRIEDARNVMKKIEHYSKWYDCELCIDVGMMNLALPTIESLTERNLSVKDIMLDSDDEFPDRNNPRVFNALSVESWVEDMKQFQLSNSKTSISPNIDSYEAVIIAWIQTRSIQGLKRAEKWAYLLKELIISGSIINVRVSPFAQIMKAWAFSGHPSGVEKVLQWTETLDEMGANTPTLKQGFKIRSLYIDALRQNQERLLSSLGVNFSDSLRIPSQCMDFVAKHLKENSLDEIDHHVFVTILDMWREIAEVLDLEESNIPIIVEKMCSVVDLYEHSKIGLRQHLKMNLSPNKSNSSIVDVIQRTDIIYEKFITSILDLCDGKYDLQGDVLENHFHRVEGFLVRRDRYLKQMICEKGDCCDEIPSLSNEFLNAVLRWGRRLGIKKSRNGDAVLLAASVLQYAIEQHEQDKIDEADALAIYQTVLDTIECVVSNEVEKKLVIKGVTSIIMKMGQPNLESYSKNGNNSDSLQTFPVSPPKSDTSKRSILKRKRFKRKVRI